MTDYNVGDLVSGPIYKGPNKGATIIGSVLRLVGKDDKGRQLAYVEPLKSNWGRNSCFTEARDE